MSRQRAPIASLSLLLVLPLAGGLAAPRLAGAESMNRIVLRVNDRIATLYDYEKRKNELIQDTNHREQDPAERQRILGQAGELVYKDMYDELLVLSHADQLGIEITDAEVDNAVQQIRTSNNLKDDQQFAQALQQAGLTEAKLRQQLKSNLRVQEVISREVRSKVKVDEEDLRRYYTKHGEEFRLPDQVQLQEVLIPEDKVASAAERMRVATEVRKALLAGKPLKEAAEPFLAQGELTGPTDLGWVSPGDLDPSLQAAVWKLPKKGVSEPVSGRGGLHVLQVIDRRDSHLKPLPEASAAIQEKEGQRIFREKLLEFMSDLQKQSMVVAQPPQEAAGFRKLISTGTQQQIPGLTTSEVPPGGPGDVITPPPGAPGAPIGINVPGPAGAAGSAPGPGTLGGLPTPAPVDTTTPPPVIQTPAQSPPPPPPSTPR